jgi:hypothetical protein
MITTFTTPMIADQTGWALIIPSDPAIPITLTQTPNQRPRRAPVQIKSDAMHRSHAQHDHGPAGDMGVVREQVVGSSGQDTGTLDPDRSVGDPGRSSPR